MANLFLTWEEAQGELLPLYCVSCAQPATEWADWRICHSRHRVFSIEYTYVDVTLPVCPSHRNLNRFFLPRVVAREIHPDGVLLSHISPGFVEAVWDYRDEMESLADAAPAGSFTPESYGGDPAYDEEVYSNPLPRRHDRQGRHEYASPGWTGGKIILIVLASLFFAPLVLLMGCGLLGLLLKLSMR